MKDAQKITEMEKLQARMADAVAQAKAAREAGDALRFQSYLAYHNELTALLLSL